MLRLVFSVFILALITGGQAAVLIVQSDVGLKIPEGFKITTIANSNTVSGITCMTLDSKGRPVIGGPGFIKTITEGVARVFAKPQSAASGLCFDGNDLMFIGAGGLWRYMDANGDGAADGPPEKWLEAPYGERGGHGIRRGPDGAWYLICGNEKKPGSITRISRDGKSAEVIAEGFANPRDLDFNSAGDLFTYDSDLERDFFMPWYTPTRIFHVAVGQDHGWQLAGGTRSWSKPEYYVDSVDPLVPIGRSSPGGVVVYRHTQFPDEFRDGLFICDQEFGKIYFCKLQKQGSTYRPRLDLFLERARNDFLPANVAVAPDGSLIVSSRSSILRIEHTAERGRSLSVPTKAQEILQAPQPLDAWSRAKWIPAAQQLGAEPFRRAITDTALTDAERIRAIEVHVELFGAIPASVLEEAATGKSAAVRARAAWALSQQIADGTAVVLRRLAVDTDATVRRCALEGMLFAQTNFNASTMLPILRQNLEHPDKRVRQATARLCARLPNAEWERLWDADAAYSIQTEFSLLLAAAWRNPPVSSEDIFARTLEAMPLARQSSLRLQGLRLLMVSLGDWNLGKPTAEVFSGYELSRPAPEEFVTNALPEVRKLFASGDPLCEVEAARLLGMLEDDSAETMERMERQFEGLNSPTATFHYLVVLTRLRGAWPDSLALKAAEFIQTFEIRLGERERRPDQNWAARLREVTDALIQKEPRLRALLEKPD